MNLRSARPRPLLEPPPAARSRPGVVDLALPRRERHRHERTAALASSPDGAAVAMTERRVGRIDRATSTSQNPARGDGVEEEGQGTAEARLEALGLSQASARRLVRRAAALRKRYRAAGGRGNGSGSSSGSSSEESDGSGSDGGRSGERRKSGGSFSSSSSSSSSSNRETSTPPTAADVESAARALLDIGFRISEVAAAIEKAPGLLNTSSGGIRRRASAFLLEEASETAAADPSSPSSPAALLSRSTLVRILRHRPAALCARSAERGLRASLAALRSLGATPRSLSLLARREPSAFWGRPAELAAAAEALERTGCPARLVPKVLCENAGTLLLGRSSASSAFEQTRDWLLSPPLSLTPQQAAAALKAEPALVAKTTEELDAVAAALVSAGVSDFPPLVEAWPRVLTKKASVVEVKARLATEVLGAPPGSLARSPRLLFDRSVAGSIGPRFAFYRSRREGGGGGGGEGAGGALGEEEEEEEDESEEGFGGGAKTKTSSSSSSSISSISPSTLLRGGDTDFCLAVGGYYSLPATLEEFSIFKKRWEAEAERGAVAEGLAEEKKRRARREQRQRRRSRRQQRVEEAEEEEEQDEREAAVEVAAASAAAAVAAATLKGRQQQQQQQEQQQQQRREKQLQQRPPQKPEAAGAALDAIATLRTRKKVEGGGGGGQK